MIHLVVEVAYLVVCLGLLVLSVVGWCMITKRLGYTPTAGLLMLVPLVNLFAFLYWAFTESPNERRIRRLEVFGAAHERDQKARSFLSEIQGTEKTPSQFLSELEKQE
jgi:hypothetical protein